MFFNRKNTNLFFKFTLLFLFLFLLKIIPFNTGFEDSIDYLNNISFPISSHFKLNKDNKLKFKSSSSCLNDTLNKYKSHLNFINSHNKAIKAKNDFIKLSDEEISSYSMLTYNEKISLLNNTNYSLEDRIHIFLGSDLENFSLVYYNISTKEKVSINENKEFKPASTYKLGLNALIYNLYLNGKLNLNDTITFENCDYEDGTGLLCSKSSIGTYTIQELLDLSIIYSDNIASNMLTRYLGGRDEVKKELYSLLNINYPYSKSTITADIEYRILMYIYDNKNLPEFNHLIEVLTKTEFHDRLDKYIPQEIVAHKIGSNESYIHDVGIIFSDSPYILVIYTNGLAYPDEKIAQISKAIYNNYN